MLRTFGEQVLSIVVYKKKKMQLARHGNRLNTAWGSLTYQIEKIPMETEHDNDHVSVVTNLLNETDEIATAQNVSNKT